MSDNPPASPQNDERSRLECDKLKAEAEALRRPFFKTPAFYSSMAPVALAICGLVFSWATGWFDVQRTRVNNDKTLLEAQTVRLELGRNELESQRSNLLARINTAESKNETLAAEGAELIRVNNALKKERDDLQDVKKALESEVTRLASSDSRAAEMVDILQNARADRQTFAHELETIALVNRTREVENSNEVMMLRWVQRVVGEWIIETGRDSTQTKALTTFVSKWGQIRFENVNYYPELLTDEERRLADSKDRTYWDKRRLQGEKRYETLMRVTTENMNTPLPKLSPADANRVLMNLSPKTK